MSLVLLFLDTGSAPPPPPTPTVSQGVVQPQPATPPTNRFGSSPRIHTRTEIQILDSNLDLITTVIAPFPLTGGNIVQYSKELSDYGQCTFRISSYDPQFATFGDILQPHANHVRIQRNNVTVWQGAIIENPRRTKDYVQVVAAEYLWYLSKKLVHRTSIDPATNTADGIYRIFNTANGATTMAAAVTAIMNETIADYQSTNHALASMTLGEIDNPNYPPNITNAASPPAALSGPWEFGDGTSAPSLTFDFHTILYILQQFGAYTYADFAIDNSRVFSFRSFLGNDLRDTVTLSWAENSDTVDFNLPRLGQRMVNQLYGIATDENGNVLHAQQSDQPSITTNGLLEGVAAYVDIKDQATLNARVQAELPMISTPDGAATAVTVDERALTPGIVSVGDVVNQSVQHRAVQYAQPRRVVGMTTVVYNTGHEETTIQLNKLLPFQPGGTS